MMTTPRPIIDQVVRASCGRDVERLTPLAGGGMNETYRADLGHDLAVVVRIARHAEPWFIDEAHLMAQAREIGVPTAAVLGLEQVEHDGELLSFSVLEFLPGRLLREVAGDLPAADLERIITDAGELLALVHSVRPDPDRGIRHELRWPEEHEVARVARIVAETLDPAAATVLERGADFLRRQITTRATPPFALAQGDFMPGNLLIHQGMIVGVLDWEFAGPAPPAFDLGRWEVSAGASCADRMDPLRQGYARVVDPESSEAGLTPAFAVDWILELLAWKNPARPAQFRRCIDVINRYT